jgi:hypothetical protein
MPHATRSRSKTITPSSRTSNQKGKEDEIGH